MVFIFGYIFARIIDILLLIAIIYGIQKYTGSSMVMNIEDHGNFIFVFTVAFCSFFAGVAQNRMDTKN